MFSKGLILPALLLAMLLCTSQVVAQSAFKIRKGPKTEIKGGRLIKPDTVCLKIDSLSTFTQRLTAIDSATLKRLLSIDSLPQRLLEADSAALGSIRQSLDHSDSTTLAGFDTLRRKFCDANPTVRRQMLYGTSQVERLDSALLDSLNALTPLVMADTARRLHKGRFMSDSMSLSKMSWFSLALPGYGQIYNKQYWKLPILYGTVGAGLALFFHENKTYKPLREQYDAFVNSGAPRTPELDALQSRMIRSNTRRQLYIGASIASYIYFIGDAAVNYATNDVSHVKKATTLACICPGAGQIYNKSYWKVPFVIGGFAALIYTIDWNNRGFKRFQTAYNLKYDWEQQESSSRPANSPDEFKGRYSTSYLKTLKDSYRRNRDLCIIITAGLYILQIVDAHVDAHLKDYDISDDLSMNIEPIVDYTFVPSLGTHTPVFGFSLRFNF